MCTISHISGIYINKKMNFYFRYDENDNLLGFELNGNQYFYITNLVGDIIAIVDNQGSAVVEYTYDPWGACTIVSDTSNCNLGTLNPFRYRGYYYNSRFNKSIRDYFKAYKNGMYETYNKLIYSLDIEKLEWEPLWVREFNIQKELKVIIDGRR